MRLDELAERIAAELVGDGSIEINAVQTLEAAQSGQVSFLTQAKYIPQLETTRASAVIVSKKVENSRLALLRTAEPYFAYQQAMVLLHGHRKHPHAGVHSKAHVEPTAKIGKNCVIYPGVYVGARATIGDDCIIYPNVVIYDDTQIGDRVIIHGGAIVGVDGFGYAQHAGSNHKIPQIGYVVIEDDCEIGPNCSIERGALAITRIGQGSKLDGLVVFGHGCTMGPHGILVAQTGIAGSVTIGHHVTLGGQTGVAGHLTIGDGVMAAGQTGIVSDVEPGQTIMGSPAMPISVARRSYAIFKRLPELFDRIRQLEIRLGGKNKS